LVALIPAAIAISALATLALVTAVCALVVAYEAIRYRGDRVPDPASRALLERAQHRRGSFDARAPRWRPS
jgi:hypothetical protein